METLDRARHWQQQGQRQQTREQAQVQLASTVPKPSQRQASHERGARGAGVMWQLEAAPTASLSAATMPSPAALQESRLDLGAAMANALTSLTEAVAVLQSDVLPRALEMFNQAPTASGNETISFQSNSRRLLPGDAQLREAWDADWAPVLMTQSLSLSAMPLGLAGAVGGTGQRVSTRRSQILVRETVPGAVPSSSALDGSAGIAAQGSQSSRRGRSWRAHAQAVAEAGRLETRGSRAGGISKSPSRGNSSSSSGSARGSGAPNVTVQQHLVAGGLAGMASRTATAPLETLRLRIMAAGGAAVEGVAGKGAQGALAAPSKLSLAGAAQELWREAGWRAFFKGNLLNVLRAAPQKAIDFAAFESFKRILHKAFPNSPAELRLAASGALAGGLSTLILYPLDSVRGRMLVQRGGAAARRFANVGDAFVTIARTEGMASLYRGLAPSFLSILPEAAITYGASDLLKMAYQQATGKEHVGTVPALLCGVAAAFTGQLVAYPLEVVARRAQVSAARVGITGSLKEILRTQGVGGLYSGIVPATAKLIPMAVISFGVYESAKVLLANTEAWKEEQQQAHGKSASTMEHLQPIAA